MVVLLQAVPVVLYVLLVVERAHALKVERVVASCLMLETAVAAICPVEAMSLSPQVLVVLVVLVVLLVVAACR